MTFREFSAALHTALVAACARLGITPIVVDTEAPTGMVHPLATATGAVMCYSESSELRLTIDVAESQISLICMRCGESLTSEIEFQNRPAAVRVNYLWQPAGMIAAEILARVARDPGVAALCQQRGYRPVLPKVAVVQALTGGRLPPWLQQWTVLNADGLGTAAPPEVDDGDDEAWFIWADAAETDPMEYDYAFEDDYHGIWDSIDAFVTATEWEDEGNLLAVPASTSGVHIYEEFYVPEYRRK